MTHLPPQVIEQRISQLSGKMLALWQPQQGQTRYAMMCPSDIDCHHMPEEEVPRLRISRCYFPGELDYFFVTQPFLQLYGFQVRWHCDECNAEMSCGTPGPINVHAALGNQG